jgi:hypothetical protein
MDPHLFTGSILANITTPSDENTILTDNTDNRSFKIDRETREIFVKIDFKSKYPTLLDVVVDHQQLMASLITAYPNQVQVLDKNDNNVDMKKIQTFSSIIKYRPCFDIHSKEARNNRPAIHTIIMKIKTSLSLSDIRNTENVIRHLKHRDIYMKMHHFGREVFDVASIGWLRDVHPTQTNHESVKEMIQQHVTARWGPNTKIPPYALVYCNPGYHKNNNDPLKTKALEIQTDRKHSRTLDNLLRSAFKQNNPIFVTWRTKYQDPTRYRLSLKAQSVYLAKTYTIPIYGVNRFEMFYIERKIMATALVQSVNHCKSTDTIGRWNVLVSKDNFEDAGEKITNILDNYETIVPDEKGKRATWDQARYVKTGLGLAGDSEGANSYATAAGKSLTSILTIEEQNDAMTDPPIFDFTVMEDTVTEPISSRQTYTSARENRYHKGYVDPNPDIASLSAQVVELSQKLLEAQEKIQAMEESRASHSNTVPYNPDNPQATSHQETTATTTSISSLTPDVEALFEAKLDARFARFEMMFSQLGLLQVLHQGNAEVDTPPPNNASTKHPADANSPDKTTLVKKPNLNQTPESIKNHSFASVVKNHP